MELRFLFWLPIWEVPLGLLFLHSNSFFLISFSFCVGFVFLSFHPFIISFISFLLFFFLFFFFSLALQDLSVWTASMMTIISKNSLWPFLWTDWSHPPSLNHKPIHLPPLQTCHLTVTAEGHFQPNHIVMIPTAQIEKNQNSKLPKEHEIGQQVRK